jgi:hypothetical protein
MKKSVVQKCGSDKFCREYGLIRVDNDTDKCWVCKKPHHESCGSTRKFSVYASKHSNSRISKETMRVCISCTLSTEDFMALYENYCKKWAHGVIEAEQIKFNLSFLNLKEIYQTSFSEIIGALYLFPY